MSYITTIVKLDDQGRPQECYLLPITEQAYERTKNDFMKLPNWKKVC